MPWEWNTSDPEKMESFDSFRRKSHAHTAIRNANKHIMMLVSGENRELNLHGLQLAKGLQMTLKQLTGDNSVTVTFNNPQGR